MSIKYCVTGATGLIGSRILDRLIKEHYLCVGIARNISSAKFAAQGYLEACDLSDTSRLCDVLHDVDVIIHCAGYAHAFGASKQDLYKNNWETNYNGTKNLVCAASKNRVKKIIFLSTTKVMGDYTNEVCDEFFPCVPTSEYGKSKLASENVLKNWGEEFCTDVIILRLAMVFGGGRGNLERMVRLIKNGFFPSIPETGNRRSIIHIDDVVNAVFAVMQSSLPSPRVYLVAGDWAPSGRELYQQICSALNKRPSFLKIPLWVLTFGARIFSGVQILLQQPLPYNTDVLNRLLKSSFYSSDLLKRETGWTPQNSTQDSIKKIIIDN